MFYDDRSLKHELPKVNQSLKDLSTSAATFETKLSDINTKVSRLELLVPNQADELEQKLLEERLRADEKMAAITSSVRWVFLYQG